MTNQGINQICKKDYNFPRKTLAKAYVLTKLYENRRVFAELQTGKAVEQCQTSIQAEIESFFAAKREMFPVQLLITGNLTKEDFKKVIISEVDLEQVYIRCEQIIRERLFARFKFFSKISLARIILAKMDPSFRLICQYGKIKKRTLFLTALAEEWNRFSWRICEIDLSSFLVRNFGINAVKEKEELTKEISGRVNGILTSIMLKMTWKMKNQVAELFYQIHDQVLDQELKLRSKFLEEKRSLSDYRNNVMNG